jgi:hypothetical protein
MRVKSVHNLQPHEQAAHTVIIEDDAGNPIFVALHAGDGIACAAIGDKLFEHVLRLAGVEKAPQVINVPAK